MVSDLDYKTLVLAMSYNLDLLCWTLTRPILVVKLAILTYSCKSYAVQKNVSHTLHKNLYYSSRLLCYESKGWVELKEHNLFHYEYKMHYWTKWWKVGIIIMLHCPKRENTKCLNKGHHTNIQCKYLNRFWDAQYKIYYIISIQ